MNTEFYVIRHPTDRTQKSEVYGPFGFEDQADRIAEEIGGIKVTSRKLEPPARRTA